MPPRDWRLRIEDMLDAADAIAKFVEGADFDTFRRDRNRGAWSGLVFRWVIL